MEHEERMLRLKIENGVPVVGETVEGNGRIIKNTPKASLL
jgi:hypothetical protein